MFNGYKWPSSIAMLNYRIVTNIRLSEMISSSSIQALFGQCVPQIPRNVGSSSSKLCLGCTFKLLISSPICSKQKKTHYYPSAPKKHSWFNFLLLTTILLVLTHRCVEFPTHEPSKIKKHKVSLLSLVPNHGILLVST